MAEERADPRAVEQLANSAAVLKAVSAASSHVTGYKAPVQTAVTAPETYTQQHGYGMIKAATADLGTTQRNAALDAQLALEALRESEQRPVMIAMDSAEKTKDGKGKDAAGADAPAAGEKGAEAAPAISTAVLSKLVEQGTRDRINESTGQALEQQQQPSQQQQDAAKKAAEEAKKPVVAGDSSRKPKGLTGLDKSTADAVQNLQKQFGKGKDDKDKPKMVVGASNSPKPPATPVVSQKAAPPATVRR